MSRDRDSFATPVDAAPSVDALLSVTERPATPLLSGRCWGTRGSLPSPGPHTVRYGGNTSCLEVRADDAVLIFDAGSGIRHLGDELAKEGRVAAELFLSHFHWDHIQGLPFFRPLYTTETTMRVHGARQGSSDVQSLIAGQMGPIYFPVPFEALSAKLGFRDLDATPIQVGSAEVTPHRVRHPMNTYGFRVRNGDSAIAYIPDNELVGGHYDMPHGWYESLCSFLDGVDVLIHDAMFTDEEYQTFAGWGHSTFRDAVRLAEDAGVRKLLLFHHSPERTDAQLDAIIEQLQNDLDRRNSGLRLGVASEGADILFEE
jgi:phosphoribosyl 1,2-cyclic phosphodiesterase